MATNEQAREIVVKLALFYGFEIDDQLQMPLYAKCLEPYSNEILVAGMNLYVQNPANDRFPIPPNKIVLEVTGRPQDDDSVANEVAARIHKAMEKYGCGVYLDEKDTQELYGKVRAFVGEVGWAVIDREGGWTNFCKRSNEGDMRIARAQIRELAKSVMSQARSGKLNQAPQLPTADPKTIGHGKSEALRQLANGALKSINPDPKETK